MDADQLALAIRWKSFDAAMEIHRARGFPPTSDMLMEAGVFQDFLSGRMDPVMIQAPTAEGPIKDEIPHTGNGGEMHLTPGTASIVVDAVTMEGVREVAESMQTVGERITKAVVSRKAKAAKKSKAKKTKPAREPAAVETGTDTQDSGNPLPNGEDPVPDATTDLPAAA